MIAFTSQMETLTDKSSTGLSLKKSNAEISIKHSIEENKKDNLRGPHVWNDRQNEASQE